MEKIILHTSKCQEGDILAADIFNKDGVLLAAKDTIINNFLRDKLIQLGMSTICIYYQEQRDAKYKIGHSHEEVKKT